VYDNSASCSTSITVVRRRCDFNDDGKVDSLDMRGLMSSLGDPTLKEAGDVNFDGRSGVQEWVTCFGRIAAKRR
jgi:hypothetical protein